MRDKKIAGKQFFVARSAPPQGLKAMDGFQQK
jgi:hypothetical protein